MEIGIEVVIFIFNALLLIVQHYCLRNVQIMFYD